ncbi:MAG: LacI family DNA-binding transcriptional regulator, partial [Clostridia bacterium]|nr:LacI family DNA-binding transcriptional regulator [Clostridia bacterium]
MANIHDIVRMTNLSLGTVSNYLNGKKIKEKNKKLIEETIKELDYKVNSFGRNLKTNHSGIIGIMVPNLDDPFAPKVISSVEQ